MERIGGDTGFTVMLLIFDGSIQTDFTFGNDVKVLPSLTILIKVCRC